MNFLGRIRGNGEKGAGVSKRNEEQSVHDFLSIRGVRLGVDEVHGLERMSPQDAMDEWTKQVNQKQQPREPRLDEGLTRLLGKLDHCGLAIKLAAAYVVKNQISTADYIRLLEDVKDELTKNIPVSSWLDKSKERPQNLPWQDDQGPLDAVALAWRTACTSPTPRLPCVLAKSMTRRRDLIFRL